MIVIAIHGPMGCGKTTACDYIKSVLTERGVSNVLLPIAKPLKDFARQLGWDGAKDEKGRRLLQLLGTECGRKCISDDIWILKWKDAVEEADTSVVLCDDMRFLNEYTGIKIMNVYHKVITIKLTGRGYEVKGLWKKLKKWLRLRLGLVHQSEIPLPDYLFDYVISNDKEVYALRCELDAVMKGVI